MNGMDRKIEKKKGIGSRTIWITLSIAFAVFLVYSIFFRDKTSRLNVSVSKLTLDEVAEDVFQDYIAVQGVVEPIKTIYLDAVEGGRVEEKLKEEGSSLKKGDVIIRLSNNNLILEISNTEAQVLRTVNELRNARNFMQQQLLASNMEILRLKNQVSQLKRAFAKNEILYASSHISEEDYLKTKEDYLTAERMLEMQIEHHLSDSVYRRVQVGTLEESVKSMTNNLRLAQGRLENLNIKAPANGELAALNPEVGEVVNYGTRIGTINILDSYKLRVDIDEHYIARIQRGLTGECDFAGSKYYASITKLYPEVRNGRFAVDMVFKEEIPPQIRIGQTSRIKLELGESKQALLLSKGGFYQSTGGRWVFVVDPSGQTASKRAISIGRQNPRYYEILEGLSKGEKVIVSSYENFGDADILMLKDRD
jgi:HlyD family secretion protein